MGSFFVFGIQMLFALCSLVFLIYSCNNLIEHLYPNHASPSTSRLNFGQRILTDLSLLAIFIVSHSFVSRIKSWTLSRAIYIFATAGSLELLVRYWEPISSFQVWNLEHKMIAPLCLALFYTGLLLSIVPMIFVDVGELFGFSQILNAYKGLPHPMEGKSAASKRIYKHNRHPNLLGLLLIFWATSIMSLDRLLLAITLTAYYLIRNGIDDDDAKFIDVAWDNSFASLHKLNPLKPNL